ncbi:hypothetical protein Tco_0886814 [Tanacetum coccineum]
MVNIEDTSVPSFGRQRVCILTKYPVSILESFKIIVKGKVFMIQAKELFMWSPSFLVNKETLCSSDDESVQGEMHNPNQSFLSEEEEGEINSSEVEGVSDTIFDDNSVSDKGYSGYPDKQKSEDPFGIYNLLKKKQPDGEAQVTSPSLSHPPGFTPTGIEPKTGNVHINEVVNDIPVNVTSPLLDTEVMNSPQVVQMEVPSGSIGQSVDSNGGSILGVLEEVIRVGQAMGYSMEGCEKDIEAIIGNQGDDVVFR